MQSKYAAGFTFVELILVIAIIGILAGVTVFLVNPSDRLADTRNTQRQVDVQTILNAVYQYAVDHNGALPDAIPTSPWDCSSATSTNQLCRTDAASCSGLVDVSSALTATATYLVSVPTDPSSASANGSGYYIVTTTAYGGRVTVCAPSAELGETISATR